MQQNKNINNKLNIVNKQLYTVFSLDSIRMKRLQLRYN